MYMKKISSLCCLVVLCFCVWSPWGLFSIVWISGHVVL